MGICGSSTKNSTKKTQPEEAKEEEREEYWNRDDEEENRSKFGIIKSIALAPFKLVAAVADKVFDNPFTDEEFTFDGADDRGVDEEDFAFRPGTTFDDYPDHFEILRRGEPNKICITTQGYLSEDKDTEILTETLDKLQNLGYTILRVKWHASTEIEYKVKMLLADFRHTYEIAVYTGIYLGRLIDKILKSMEEKDKKTPKKLIVVGHSLGACLSSFIAAQISAFATKSWMLRLVLQAPALKMAHFVEYILFGKARTINEQSYFECTESKHGLEGWELVIAHSPFHDEVQIKEFAAGILLTNYPGRSIWQTACSITNKLKGNRKWHALGRLHPDNMEVLEDYINFISVQTTHKHNDFWIDPKLIEWMLTEQERNGDYRVGWITVEEGKPYDKTVSSRVEEISEGIYTAEKKF